MADYDIPFGQARLDQSKQKDQSRPGALKRLENLLIDETGALSKRPGTRALTGISGDTPLELFVHEDQLCAAGQGYLWSWSEEEQTFRKLDQLTQTSLRRKHTLGHYGGRDVFQVDVARTDSFTCWMWVTISEPLGAGAGTQVVDVHVMTVDNETGTASPATLVATNSSSNAFFLRQSRLCRVGSKVVLFMAIPGADAGIQVVEITSPLSGGALPTPTTIVDSGIVENAASQWYDVAPQGTGYLLIYRGQNSAGNAIYYLELRANNHTIQHAISANAGAHSGLPVRVGVVGNFTQGSAICGICVRTDTRLVVRTYSSTLTLVTSVDQPYEPDSVFVGRKVRDFVIGHRVLSGEDCVMVGCNFDAQSTWAQFGKLVIFPSSGRYGAAGVVDFQFTGKLKQLDGQILCPGRYWANQANSTHALLRFDPAMNPIGADGYYTEMALLQGQVPQETPYDPNHDLAWDPGSGTLLWPIMQVDRFSAPTYVNQSQQQNFTLLQTLSTVACDGYELRWRDPERWSITQAAGYTHLSGGGAVLSFDSRRTVEFGFFLWPKFGEARLVVGTGGDLRSGTYQYAIVAEWIDFKGNRTSSAYEIFSATIPPESDGTGRITLSMPPEMGLLNKFWQYDGGDSRPITLAIYRSQRNEEQLFRLEGQGVQPFREVARFSTVLQVPYTWVDNYSDTSIALSSRELIYSNSGSRELFNRYPPASTQLVFHDNRCWGIDAADPTIAWYAKQYFAGSGGGWNPSLNVQFPEPLVALSAQDGNLLGFTALGKVYTVVTRPADNTGGGNDYVPPALLSTNKSLLSPRSLVNTPAGLFYQSSRGIEFQGRGGAAVEWGGKAVADILREYPTVTCTGQDPSRSLVLFGLSNGSTGRVLVYDYEEAAWFMWNYGNRIPRSIALWRDSLIYAWHDGAVWAEDSGWDDAGGSYVPCHIETYPITAGSEGLLTERVGRAHSALHIVLQGQQRSLSAPETVYVSESSDGGATWTVEEEYHPRHEDEEGLWARVHQLLHRKAPSHAFRIRTAQFGSHADSPGVSFQGLSLNAKPLPGRLQLPRGLRG